MVDFTPRPPAKSWPWAIIWTEESPPCGGTHTHVPTADRRVYPKGTGYITDLGMTGAVESVLGIEPWQSVESFLGGLPGRYKSPSGPGQAAGRDFYFGQRHRTVHRRGAGGRPVRRNSR